MEIKYEIDKIKNAKGEGETHLFVRLKLQPGRTEKELIQEIEHSCSLSGADVRAVLSELQHIIAEDLSSKGRFHLHNIGYLSVSAGLNSVNESEKKITGKDIFLRGINFQPEKELLDTVRNNVTFHHSKTSSKSVQYTEDVLWQNVEAYLDAHRYLTVSIMCSEFGLSRTMASKWLSVFVAGGRLVKEGTPRRPLYFKGEPI